MSRQSFKQAEPSREREGRGGLVAGVGLACGRLFNGRANLLLILTLFTCTFFIYKDFAIPMSLGFGLLGLFPLVRLAGLLKERRLPALSLFDRCVLWALLAVLLSVFRWDALFNRDHLLYAISLSICACCYFLTHASARGMEAVLRVFRVAALAFACFVVFFALFKPLYAEHILPRLSEASRQYYERFIPRGFSYALGASYTYTDYVLFMGAAVGVAGLGGLATRGARVLRLAEILFLAAAMFLVGRRGEVLALACALAVACFAGQARAARRRSWLALLALLLGAAALLLLFAEPLRQSGLFARYIRSFENLLAGRDVSSGRILLYRIALDLFLAHPLLGIGWGQFARFVPADFKALHGADVSSVHNVYLQFLCELGLVGALLIMLPLAYLFWQTLRQRKRIRALAPGAERALLERLNLSSLMIQTFFAVVGLLDPTFTKYVFWCFYIIALKFSAYALEVEGYAYQDRFARALNRLGGRLSGPNKEG